MSEESMDRRSDGTDAAKELTLNQRLRSYFDGRIVRKDLTKAIKEGANVPVILHDIRKTIIEYGGNEQFVVHGGYLDMGIVDTMKDLFVNFIGALVFSTFGYFYVKQRDEDKHSFAERFIPIIEKRGDA
jgi:hypothetical protein